jgi:hypothetical protein
MTIGVINNNITDSLNTAQQFIKNVRTSLFSIMQAVNVARYDKSYVGAGVQGGLGKSITTGANVTSNPTTTNAFSELYPREYNIASMTPTANVIVKKRMFTTLAYNEDVRFLDSNERSFLRSSKNLFQLKAFQIATYEALTKFEQMLKQDKTMYVPAILSVLQNANAFGAISNDEASTFQSLLLQITQRDLAGEDTIYTRWFINRFDIDLANIGRGVGVIEFGNFTKIDVSNGLTSDGSATVDFEDPYHIMMISNDDIEAAISGALFDNFTSTLLPSLAIDDLRALSDKLQTQINNNDPIKNAQAIAAINTIQQTAYNVLSQQHLSPDAISFVRKKMRKFYLGKAIIQPTDGIHIFMKSDTIFENDQDPVGLPLGLDRYGIDEEILKQEMYVVTGDKNFDINLYKTLRDPNAFSGASVFAGIVEKVADNFSDGFYTLSVGAKNNLWYLEQSFINAEPALDQSQGFLHDPLTPFDFKFDNFGNIKTTDNNGNAGFQLSQDNIDRLNQVNIKYDNGTLRGSHVNTNNIITGASPGTNIKQATHFPGMLYKWKEGIASVSIPMNTSDPTGLFSNQSREAVNEAAGLSITSTPFDNMDAANVVSLLVTGLPYNISTFINDGLITGTVNNFSTSSSYFSSFFDIVQRQNKVLGNFKPLLNGDSVNIDTIKKLAYKKTSFRQLDIRIGELETQIFEATQRLHSIHMNIGGPDSDLVDKTIKGLKSEIAELRQEEDSLIQQYTAISEEIKKTSNNQDALGFSLDPAQREVEIKNYQFQQLYAASRRIEDVRYNRDINYFIVGTEYDSDLDIQAFQANLRNGFKYFDNRYDSAITKAREAARVIDFEFFADSSGNIRFRPPQYNKIPLSIYYDLFRRKGQQGINILPEFVQNMFVNQVTTAHENIVQVNWNILIALGKSGDNSLINAMNAYVVGDKGITSKTAQSILSFLGYFGDPSAMVSDGNVTDELIEFNSAEQVRIDQAVPAPSRSAEIKLTFEVLQNISTQMEKRFGASRMVISQDDIVAQDDDAAITKRKLLFETLRNLVSQRNAYIKQYLSQLNNLGVDAKGLQNISGSTSSQQTQEQVQQVVNNAIVEKQNKFSQEMLQVISTGNIQGYARPSISTEFQNLVEDDTRNFIGRGSGRRFIIRDDSIISFRIEENQPDYCRINVIGAPNFVSSSVMENRWLWAGAVDYDLWRMYGFKTGEDVKTPFLSDPENQLKPYAVFLLLRQRSKVMHGNVTVIGNEYYQLGDVVYLPDRDMLFYVTGISHSFGEGADFTTSLTLEYGRPPGEYIPTPLDVIGKTLLKQNASNVAITKRQINPDTFYYPLRPTPVLYLSKINATSNTEDATQIMLGTDSNQGRLINTLMNANLALQKPNAVLVISGFQTSKDGYADIQKRVDIVKQWFLAPKVISSGINKNTLIDMKDYSAIQPDKILTKILNISIEDNTPVAASDNSDPNEVIASDQFIINTIGDPILQLGIISACQEAYSLIDDMHNLVDELPNVVEIGIFYQKSK